MEHSEQKITTFLMFDGKAEGDHALLCFCCFLLDLGVAQTFVFLVLTLFVAIPVVAKA